MQGRIAGMTSGVEEHPKKAYARIVPGRTCIVGFHTRDGKWWCHVTAARPTHEAVWEGWEFFQDSFWHGPKPTPETVFEISLVGDERPVEDSNETGGRWR